MREERPQQQEEREDEEGMIMDIEEETVTQKNYKYLDNLDWKQQKRRAQKAYDQIITAANEEKVSVPGPVQVTRFAVEMCRYTRYMWHWQRFVERRTQPELEDLVPPKRVTVRSRCIVIQLILLCAGLSFINQVFFLARQTFGAPSLMNSFHLITISQHSRGGLTSSCC